MNYDKEIINRALADAGEEPLTDKEIETDGTRWRMAKGYYLQTILETLSNTEWTSQKKRSKLVIADEENLTEYQFSYILPVDCAKPISLGTECEYMIEGDRLYTNAWDDILLYVSNGKIAEEENYLMEDDIPEYSELKFDALLSEYIEKRLASKFVLKLTGNAQLYNMLYQESLIMENRAIKNTLAHGRSKDQGEDWWYNAYASNSKAGLQ